MLICRSSALAEEVSADSRDEDDEDGEIPTSQIRARRAAGIQAVFSPSFAFFAMLNVGTAMRATTAGGPAEDGGDGLVVPELVEEHGYQQDDDERGSAVPNAVNIAPLTLEFVAYEKC